MSLMSSLKFRLAASLGVLALLSALLLSQYASHPAATRSSATRAPCC